MLSGYILPKFVCILPAEQSVPAATWVRKVGGGGKLQFYDRHPQTSDTEDIDAQYFTLFHNIKVI